MIEQMDEREVRYFGQEAAIAIQNKALVRAFEDMQQDAVDLLIDADPFDGNKVAICQLRIKAVAELAERLEHMAARAVALNESEELTNMDLN